MHFFPSVTVLMATFNGQEFLRQQIDSILNQTYPHFKLVIADDGSSDKTFHIIQEYAAQYPNVKFYINASRLGFVKNFEQLIESEEGQYFALADQDDLWDKDKLMVSMNAMLDAESKFHGSPVMVHSDLRMMDESGRLISPSYSKFRGYRFNQYKDVASIISRCGVMGNTLLFNANLKQLILPFGEHVVHHDYWIAVINELFGIRVSLKEPLASYRIHHNNASQKRRLLKKSKNLNDFVTLPYRDNNRYEVLKEVTRRYQINRDDRRVLLLFIRYLRREEKWLRLYPSMLQKGFFRDRGVSYHSKLLGKFFLASSLRRSGERA